MLATVLVWVGRGAWCRRRHCSSPTSRSRATSQDLVPLDPIAGSVSAATVAEWGGALAAYTAVHAPAGLRQAIEHVWWRDGRMIARVPLSPVLGGRAQGFRTWSRKSDLRRAAPGAYAVDVMTASGQLIGRLSFTVTP